MNDLIVIKIMLEAKHIEEDALYSAKGHFYAGQFWANLHLWIGIPTACISAIAGASALSQFDYHSVVAGILAIIVAASTAVSTFLNPNEQASRHKDSGNNYNGLRNQSRIFYEIEIKTVKNETVAFSILKRLNNDRDNLNKESPQIPKWAFQKAKKGVESGEAAYRI